MLVVFKKRNRLAVVSVASVVDIGRAHKVWRSEGWTGGATHKLESVEELKVYPDYFWRHESLGVWIGKPVNQKQNKPVAKKLRHPERNEEVIDSDFDNLGAMK